MLTSLILSVGDELTLGQTVDTNSAWLSRRLAALGIDISGHMTVPDDRDKLAAAIRHAAAAVDLLVISGGLGPTEDDLTREALADAMGVDLVRDEDAMKTLKGFFVRIGRPMPQRNEVQAFVPRGASPIPNANGTAPGLATVLETAGHTCRVAVMPGVPKEMFAMWEASIEPQLRELTGGAVILSRTLHTFGLGESSVAQRLGDLMMRSRNPSVGTTVSHGVVSLRLNVRADSAADAKRLIDETHRQCVDALGLIIYGQDDETLPQVVARLLRGTPSPVSGGVAGSAITGAADVTTHPAGLAASAQTAPNRTVRVATAESCTGGLLAKYLTDQPGSSAYFTHGFITYSNEAKTQLLAVSPDLIAQHGAVSEPVAAAMAIGALTAANADIALSISGIAGPDGGTPTKPVGTITIALAHRDAQGQPHSTPRTFLFPGDREMIRDRSAKMALTLLRYHLLEEKCPF